MLTPRYSIRVLLCVSEAVKSIRNVVSFTLAMGLFLVAGLPAATANDALNTLVEHKSQGNWVPPELIAQTRESKSSSRMIQAFIESSDTRFDVQLNSRAIVGRLSNGKIDVRPSKTLRPGASILIGRHWQDRQRFQHASASQANYLSLQGASADQWSVQTIGTDGVYGGLKAPAESILFTLQQGSVSAGETVSFALKNIELPELARKNYSFGVFLSTSERDELVPIQGNAITLYPAEFASIKLAADALVTPGEALSVTLRMEDAFGNLVADRSLSLDLLVNGVFRQQVDATTAIQAIQGVSFDVVGDYFLELRSGGGGLRATSNPIKVQRSDQKIVWADIGTTTIDSDGIWTFEELSRNRAGDYDLVIPVDHAAYLPENHVAQIADVRIVPQWTSTADESGYTILSRNGASMLRLVQAETTTDIRWLTPRLTPLTEVVSRNSNYRWLSDRIVNAGYPTGVSGSQHSHEYPQSAKPVYTAIVTTGGQHWFDALGAQQTYVSVGEKIILQGLPTQISTDTAPKFSMTASANSSIRHISLYKNGVLVKREASGKGEPVGLTLGLFSSSQPWGRHSSEPRNAREWVGFIVARGTEISATETFGWDIRQGSDRSRLDFYSKTHGQTRRLDFQLNEMNPDTVIELTIAPGYEDAAWLPVDRLPTETAPARFTLGMNEVSTGSATRKTTNTGYDDTVTLNLQFDNKARISSIQYRDLATPRTGDYFQFIVELVNGHYAMSSPIYVGDS